MVKRASVPYIPGIDFRAEFYREEREELEGFSFDEKPVKSKSRKERSKREVKERVTVPVPTPPPSVVNVGRKVTRRTL